MDTFQVKRKRITLCNDAGYDWPYPNFVSSLSFNTLLGMGSYALLGKNEFEDFKALYFDKISDPLKDLFRSHKELDEFLPREDLQDR